MTATMTTLHPAPKSTKRPRIKGRFATDAQWAEIRAAEEGIEDIDQSPVAEANRIAALVPEPTDEQLAALEDEREEVDAMTRDVDADDAEVTLHLVDDAEVTRGAMGEPEHTPTRDERSPELVAAIEEAMQRPADFTLDPSTGETTGGAPAYTVQPHDRTAEQIAEINAALAATDAIIDAGAGVQPDEDESDPGATLEVLEAASDPVAPAKAKRGRPRKNPEAEVVVKTPRVKREKGKRVRLARTEKPVTIVIVQAEVDGPLTARIYTSRLAAISAVVTEATGLQFAGESKEERDAFQTAQDAIAGVAKVEERLTAAVNLFCQNGGSLSVRTVRPTHEFTI